MYCKYLPVCFGLVKVTRYSSKRDYKKAYVHVTNQYASKLIVIKRLQEKQEVTQFEIMHRHFFTINNTMISLADLYTIFK